MTVLGEVMADLSARQQRGLVKYGTTVDRTDLSASDWEQHLYEELLDAVMYLKRRMLERAAIHSSPPSPGSSTT